MTDDDLYDDDDFDLDDFDGFDDDLDDDFGLDEFDNKPRAKSQKTVNNNADQPYVGYANTEQTFLQKYFYGVVVFVAMALAGLWFLAQGLNAPPRNAQQTQTAQSTNDTQNTPTQADNNDEDIAALLASDSDLPMPVPLNSFAEDEALPVYQHRERKLPPPRDDAQNNEQMYDPGVLTPLPNGIGSGYNDDAIAAASQKNQQALVQIDQLSVNSDTPQNNDENTDNSEGDDADFDSLFKQNPGMTLSVKQSDLEENDNDTKKTSVLDTVQNLLDGSTKKSNDDTSSLKNDAAATAQIGTIKTELATVNDRLSKRIETTDTKIDDLVSVIKSLEQKIERLDTNDKSTAAPSTKTPTQKIAAAAPKKTVTKSAPTKAVVNTPVKATPKKHKISWQLRSAQTGRAVVSVKGTNDFRTVEVGTTLSGIGKIKSIMIENGRWVVRGSQGKITQ